MATHIEITDGMRILFQGDSITDAGRGASPSGLGTGYAQITSGLLGAAHAGKNLQFFNRGISGNRAKNLVGRWDKDCIDLKPDLVSILIGINDTWRRYDSNDPTSSEEYEENFRTLLTRVRDELGAKIVIMEPFLLPHPEDRIAWREDLDPKIAVARRLAAEFADVYVPLDGEFNAAAVQTGPEYLAGDGVHPTLAGHALIALSWIRAVTGATLG